MSIGQSITYCVALCNKDSRTLIIVADEDTYAKRNANAYKVFKNNAFKSDSLSQNRRTNTSCKPQVAKRTEADFWFVGDETSVQTCLRE